ncbi:hypothetical protein E4U13_001554 [Claviceps humidiphila]|uniref:Uncharacterized protein n=1 Tax=Claviceps humidiphila TaxID=1294629 RepID=A0A9P7Q2F3_9HYPO|nr:hypothetical protein E4U13_001554 [Claviceps humidiphila]
MSKSPARNVGGADCNWYNKRINSPRLQQQQTDLDVAMAVNMEYTNDYRWSTTQNYHSLGGAFPKTIPTV